MNHNRRIGRRLYITTVNGVCIIDEQEENFSIEFYGKLALKSAYTRVKSKIKADSFIIKTIIVNSVYKSMPIEQFDLIASEIDGTYKSEVIYNV